MILKFKLQATAQQNKIILVIGLAMIFLAPNILNILDALPGFASLFLGGLTWLSDLLWLYFEKQVWKAFLLEHSIQLLPVIAL